MLFDSHNFPLKNEVGFVEFILQLEWAGQQISCPDGTVGNWQSQDLTQRPFLGSGGSASLCCSCNISCSLTHLSWLLLYPGLITFIHLYWNPSKHLVFGHLVLEINQRQSQEAWAYFPAYGKATHLLENSGWPPELRAIILPLLRLLVPKAGWVKWLELQFLEEINSPRRNFTENNYLSLIIAQLFWLLAAFSWDGATSMVTKRLPSEVLHLWTTLFILPLSDEARGHQNFVLLAFSLLVFICFGKG